MSEETLFALALQIPEAERAALLDRECAGNPELRSRVEALLQADAEPGDFLPAIQADETAPYPGSPDASMSEQPGTVIAGKYKLVKQIGHGAMGAVWMAEQSEPVKRQVAVKLILADRYQSRRIVSRFQAERQAIALMDHPHIARLFDAGTTTGGAPFFVMELIRGVELTGYCDQHQLSVPDRLQLFMQICTAVQHAHQKGIIHRDLKPANILVESHDGKPVPKVIDFGLAKVAGGLQLTEHALSTHVETVFGTPLYMAPEQATFNAVDVDTRADIYSLGVILYELLTGSTPIEREQVKKAALDEVLRVIREQEPPTPSKRLSTTDSKPSVAANRHTEPAKLSRLVHGDLDWIVMRALAKDRDRRYATANGLAADIECFLNHEPVEARPPSVGYRLRKFVRRNRGPVLAAGLAASCLMAGVIGTSLALVEARRQRNEAEASRAAERDERDRTAAALGREHAALGELAEEKRQTDRALSRERHTASLHRVTLAHREWLMNDPVRAADVLAECPPELRAWEWYYVRRLLHTELTAFRGHKRQVTGVAFDPDGTRVISADASVVAVWDAATGVASHTLPGREEKALSGAWSVAYSPDGRWLATGGWQTVAVWDARTRKEVWWVQGHDSNVRGIVFSPDGKRVATASGIRDYRRETDGGEVKVWDAATGKELLRLPVRSAWANCVAFSPDGRFIAAGAGKLWSVAPLVPTEVLVWDAKSGKEVVVLKGHGHHVMSVAFSPDSQRLAAAGADRTVRVWDVPSGQAVHTLRGHTKWVRAVAFTPDGTELVSAGDDRVIRVWDAATGLERRVIRGHTHPVQALAINRDGTCLASASGDDRTGGEVRVWDLMADQTARTFREHASQVTAISFDPTGRLFASGSESRSSDRPGEVLVREVGTGKTTLKLSGKLVGFTAVRFAPTGEFLAAHGDQGVNLWNPETGAALTTLRVRFFVNGSGLAVSRDGKTIAAVTNGPVAIDGRAVNEGVTLWDRASGQEVRAFRGHTGNVSDVAFHPDGEQFATSSVGGLVGSQVNGKWVAGKQKLPNEVKVWDTKTGREIRTLSGGGLGLAYNADGTALASSSPEGPVTVWDTTTWEVRATLRGHTGVVNGVAFSPDGGRVATAGADQTVRLWDAVTGHEVMILRGHDEPVTAVAFSADGRYIASGGGTDGEPGQVRVWDAGGPPRPNPIPAVGK